MGSCSFSLKIARVRGESNENINFFLLANLVQVSSEQLSFSAQALLCSMHVFQHFTNATIPGVKKKIGFHAQPLVQQYETEGDVFLKCIVTGDESWVHCY